MVEQFERTVAARQVGGLVLDPALKIALPWLGQEVQDTIALMGKDFWNYGTKENKAALEAFLQYHYEQGLSGKTKFKIEDIFIPSTLEISRL